MHYILRRRWVGNPTTLNIAAVSDKFSVHSTHDGPPPNPDGGYVFRWGTTSTIDGEAKVVNTASAIHWVYNKRDSRLELFNLGLAPTSWGSYTGYFLDVPAADKKVLVRPKHHMRGQDMILCENAGQVMAACNQECMNEGYYISLLVDKAHEYRVFYVSGRVIGMGEKNPVDRSAIHWGCADEEGGSFKYIPWSQWPTAVANVAVAAGRVSKIDFAAIDVIVDQSGKAYVLELNTAPSMTKYYSELFGRSFDYIIDNGKDVLPLGNDGGWRSFIHPAISSEAKVAA